MGSSAEDTERGSRRIGDYQHGDSTSTCSHSKSLSISLLTNSIDSLARLAKPVCKCGVCYWPGCEQHRTQAAMQQADEADVALRLRMLAERVADRNGWRLDGWRFVKPARAA